MIDSFSGQYRFLSNFYQCKVELEGIVYPSSEHAFVAYKTEDIDIRNYVAAIGTPGEAKRFGRKIILRDNWDGIKFLVMRMIVREKFYQNPILMDKLVATRPYELIEGNTWGDTYWGVCNGKGLNSLGLILMYVRDFPICTCITKTPDLNYHKEDCYARRYAP
jgi:ribA/ribD-fused uncharacterized protein